MEFQGTFENDKKWTTPDEYMGWEEDDEEEEALSLCDLVTERGSYKSAGLPVEWKSSLRDSNPGYSHRQDFDFDVGRSSSTAHNICAADDLFHQGRLLPLSIQRCGSESNSLFSYRKSNSGQENRRMLNEKLQSWRTDSLDLRSTYRTSYSSNNSHSSQRKGYYSASIKKLQRVNFATPSSNSRSKANRASKPPPSVSKTCKKWQQLLIPGLVQTSPMKVKDMPLKQKKPNTNGLLNTFVQRSISCSYHEEAMVEKKEHRAANFQQKSKSMKENSWIKETPTSMGSRMLAPLKSFNNCRSSTNSVMNCSIIKEREDGGGSAEATTTTRSPRTLSVQGDQNKMNLLRGSTKSAASEKLRRGSDPAILGSSAKKSKWIFPKIVFRRKFT